MVRWTRFHSSSGLYTVGECALMTGLHGGANTFGTSSGSQTFLDHGNPFKYAHLLKKIKAALKISKTILT